MKKIIISASFFALVCVLFFACGTDVPLSYSTKITNEKIIGWWQIDDSTAMSIEKTASGIAQMQGYKFDWNKNSYVKEEKAATLYFTNVTDSKGTINFISSGENSNYETSKVHFSTNGNLIFTPISHDFLKKYNKVVDDVVIFETPEKYKAFIKSNLRFSSLYEDEMEYQFKGSFSNLNIPAAHPKVIATPPQPTYTKTLNRDGSYGIYQLRTRKFIRELNTWDDYGEWTKADESRCTAKFFSNGMMLKLNIDGETIEVYGANLSYSETVKSTDGTSNFYIYTGIAKQDGSMLGNFKLSILEATYSDLLNGTKDSYRFDVQFDYVWNNLRNRGFWDSAFNGVDQVHLGLLANTK